MKIRRSIQLVAGYLAVTLIMVTPFVNYRALAAASYEGDARLVIWILAWDNHATLSRLPLFDSNIFYPAQHSLEYNEHLFGISLFTLPVYAATRNPVLAYNIVWLLSFVLAGLSMHALLRRYTPHDLAAGAGSLIYTFSFYKMLHGHGHLQLTWNWLVPLSLWLLERWVERPSWPRAVAWASAVTLQALGSWYLAVLVVLANGILLIWRHAAVRTEWRRRLLQLAVVTTAALVVISPFARHYWTMAPPAMMEASSMSADVASYLMPPEHTWMGRLWLAHVGRGPRWLWGERTLYLGWIALTLGTIGLCTVAVRKRWRLAGPYLLIAGVALALSFGPATAGPGPDWSPYAVFVRAPGLAGFRAPARFGLLVLLGLGLLAALGADALLTRWRRGALGLSVLMVVMLSEWFVVGFPGGRPQPFPIPAIYRTDVVRSARALVSLPDYRSTPHWFYEPDYLLFSTVHWRPIVNGYGRTEPPQQSHVVSHMMAFPGPNNARTMRALGVDYVVLHAARYPDGAAAILRVALDSPEYDLVSQIGTDYVFRVKPVR